MSKVKLTVTAPDGTILSRTTERQYRYAVAFQIGKRWVARNWCSRLDLAQKIGGVILPVNEAHLFDNKAEQPVVSAEPVQEAVSVEVEKPVETKNEVYVMTAEEFAAWTKNDSLEDLQWKHDYAVKNSLMVDAEMLMQEIERRNNQ